MTSRWAPIIARQVAADKARGWHNRVTLGARFRLEREAEARETARVQRMLLERSLLRTLWQFLSIHRNGPGEDVLGVMTDGQWRTRTMIDQARGLTTSSASLPWLVECGALEVTRVGRRLWYRRRFGS